MQQYLGDQKLVVNYVAQHGVCLSEELASLCSNSLVLEDLGVGSVGILACKSKVR